MIWDDIVTGAFEDLAVIQPGETLTSTLLTSGENRLNQLLSSLNTEGLVAFQQVMQVFNLITLQPIYTLGAGGSFATFGGLRAQKVTAWRALVGDMVQGGPVVSMADFGAASAGAQKELMAVYSQAVLDGLISTVPAPLTAAIPTVVGADTSYPLINVRVWPPPSAAPGQLELAYWTPVPQIFNFSATVALPEGWPQMLRSNLAVAMYPQYARAGGIPPELAAAAQNSKGVVMGQNNMSAAPVAAPPVGAAQ